MKKILIVIHDMKLGGAQKSLLSFLKGLTMSEHSEDYQIHLMLMEPAGCLCSQIPEQVKVILPSPELYWMSTHFGIHLLKQFSWGGLSGELHWILSKKLGRFSKQQNRSQQMWKCWKDRIPEMEESYDVAISYIDGCPNYFVMDKVKAKKKILWYHSEYQKHNYDPEFDGSYLERCDKIITVSELCRRCLCEAFPMHRKKICVLENITLRQEVLDKSKEFDVKEYQNVSVPKLLTVGRLHPMKGIDLAIDAAKCLKEKGFAYIWLVVGEGAERPALQRRIEEHGLQEQFILLGARENPYPYMAQCDIVVQPSRVEGKSIVLDEAMLLGKPAVVTNYGTVEASVTHGKTGWIVEMKAEAICEGLLHLWENQRLRDEIKESLKCCSQNNEDSIKRYLQMMF